MFCILSLLLFLYSSLYIFLPRTFTYIGVIRDDDDCCYYGTCGIINKHFINSVYLWLYYVSSEHGTSVVHTELMKDFLKVKLRIYYCLKTFTFCVRGCDIDFSLCRFHSLDFCLANI